MPLLTGHENCTCSERKESCPELRPGDRLRPGKISYRVAGGGGRRYGKNWGLSPGLRDALGPDPVPMGPDRLGVQIIGAQRS